MAAAWQLHSYYMWWNITRALAMYGTSMESRQIRYQIQESINLSGSTTGEYSHALRT